MGIFQLWRSAELDLLVQWVAAERDVQKDERHSDAADGKVKNAVQQKNTAENEVLDDVGQKFVDMILKRDLFILIREENKELPFF